MKKRRSAPGHRRARSHAPSVALFIAQLIRLVKALAASARALKIVGQQLSHNSIVRTNPLGPLALHVDHELRSLVVGRSPTALLRISAGHKNYDERYDGHYHAHRMQNSVTHRPLQ